LVASDCSFHHLVKNATLTKGGKEGGREEGREGGKDSRVGRREEDRSGKGEWDM